MVKRSEERSFETAQKHRLLLFSCGTMDKALTRNRLLPESLFALSKTFFDKSKACSRRFQNSPFGLKQLKSLFFRFAKIYGQKTF